LSCATAVIATPSNKIERSKRMRPSAVLHLEQLGVRHREPRRELSSRYAGRGWIAGQERGRRFGAIGLIDEQRAAVVGKRARRDELPLLEQLGQIRPMGRAMRIRAASFV
jgi:hypothetical protein